jgi:hypothetical protein
MVQYRLSFWGKSPTRIERQRMMKEKIASAREVFMSRVSDETFSAKDYPDKLIFMADGVEMCEQAFVHMLGLATRQGYKSPVWIREKQYFTGTVVCLQFSKCDVYNLFAGL